MGTEEKTQEVSYHGIFGMYIVVYMSCSYRWIWELDKSSTCTFMQFLQRIARNALLYRKESTDVLDKRDQNWYYVSFRSTEKIGNRN
jgi:hypothetical protein